MSELFVKLKAEGILTTADTEGIVRKAKEPPARLRIPQVDSYYAVHVQQQLGIPLFDWEGKLAKTAGTLAPSTTRPNRQPPKAALKLTYLWSIIARPTQVVPPLDSLPGEAGAAYRKVLKMQTPSWQQLERCEIDIDEYTLALTQFTDLYEKIDGPIRSSARRKFDQLLRFRDRTSRERRHIAPLILEAFDDDKEVAAYVAKTQRELNKAIPSLFPAAASATGKCVIGLATMAAPWIAKLLGYDLPGPETAGIPIGVSAIRAAIRDVRTRREERRAANPLRFMVTTAKKLGLDRAGA